MKITFTLYSLQNLSRAKFRFVVTFLSSILQALGASIAAMIGTGMVAHSLPYTPGFGTKQLAWLTHCGVMGALIAPLAFFGGTVLIRAAW
jgi:NO-binding membrane sensor protein with MHYT domain